jgi:putative aldouronate transport system substrate-binding protein
VKATANRRQMLGLLGAGSGILILAACGQAAPAPTPQAQPTDTPKPAPTTAPAPQATSAPAPAGAPAATTAPSVSKGLGHSPAPPELQPAPAQTPPPIVSQPLTLSFWIPLNSVASSIMKTYNDNEAYKLKEKRTGIHIDFQHPAVGSETEQFNLMIASGKYPDLIYNDWTTVAGGLPKLLQDGVIIKLNDLIDQNAAYYKNLLKIRPDWRKQLVTDEGDLLCFPCISGDIHEATWQGPMVRKDWLAKVNLEVPSTIDQWHTMLTAFKQQHPSGKPDDIPFTIARNNAAAALSNHAFVGAWGITMAFYQDNGVVKFGPAQPEFKDFLNTMAMWYKEGLIDPDYVTTNQQLFDAKVTGEQLGSFVANTGSGIGRFMGLMGSKDPKFDLVGAPYPVLKAGDKPLLGQRDPWYIGLGATLTAANKHVKESAQWLDWNYGGEGWMAFNFGIENVSYKIVDGYPQYTDEIMHNPQGLAISQALTKYSYAVTDAPMVFDVRYFEQYSSLPQQKNAVEVWSQPTNERVIPPVSPTKDEATRLAPIMNDVNTRFAEAFNKTVTGAQPVSDWDQVVTQLKGMGIDNAIKIQQAALDRYNKR